MVGIERQSATVAELRRMVVQRTHRRRGIARMLLAMRLYEASGYRRMRTDRSAETTHKAVGSLTRHYYEKKLV